MGHSCDPGYVHILITAESGARRFVMIGHTLQLPIRLKPHHTQGRAVLTAYMLTHATP